MTSDDERREPGQEVNFTKETWGKSILVNLAGALLVALVVSSTTVQLVTWQQSGQNSENIKRLDTEVDGHEERIRPIESDVAVIKQNVKWLREYFDKSTK